jgi:hypothetical protein
MTMLSPKPCIPNDPWDFETQDRMIAEDMHGDQIRERCQEHREPCVGTSADSSPDAGK